MPNQSKEILSARNAVAVCGAGLLGLIGIMGIMMGWALYSKTFSSYSPFFQNLFSLGTASILEISLIWFGYQLTKAAATWIERGWAIVGAAIILTIIGLNISTHNATMRGAALAIWQANYINYLGPGVIVIVAALVIVQLLLRPEVKASFREAMREFEVKERVDDIEDEVLGSDEFSQWLKHNFSSAMMERAARRAGYDASRHTALPGASQKKFQPPTVEGEVIEERPYTNGKAPGKDLRH